MMSETAPVSSARRDELLDRAYRYVTEHGLAAMSLRPLATEIGSSPRVLLFLFGSKDGLVRALLARARAEEMAYVQRVRLTDGVDLARIGLQTWRWLTALEHRGLLTLWTESYARSLIEPDGPWAGFAASTVDDWLALLADTQPAGERETAEGEARRTLVLAILRGALLDLLATGDLARTTRAVTAALDSI
jgi:AcrR family transcriptional regulator